MGNVREARVTYISLKLRKLQSSAVDFNHLLRSALLIRLVDIGAGSDRGRMGFLVSVSISLRIISDVSVLSVARTRLEDKSQPTWHSLHFQTKFASPLLPGISCCSCIYSKFPCLGIYRTEKQKRTYEAVEADPVGVSFTARGALHFESVVVGLFLSVLGTEVGDAVWGEDM